MFEERITKNLALRIEAHEHFQISTETTCGALNSCAKILTLSILCLIDDIGHFLTFGIILAHGISLGDLKVLVGFDPEGNILGYTLLEHAETPGLGAKADKWFQKGEKGDIIGKDPKDPLTVAKDGGQVDAITASTITSRAFLLAVNNAYSAYKSTPATDGETGATKQEKED
jgi:electron transport complex protein RnfG